MDSMRAFKFQRGYGLAAIVFLMLVTVITGVVGWSTYLARQSTNNLVREQRAYLEKVAASIESAYQTQLNVFEAAAPSGGEDAQADAIRLALLPVLNGTAQQKWDTQIDVSHRFIATGGTVPGRNIVVWLRRFGGMPIVNTSALNRGNGTFNIAPDDTPFIAINTTAFNTIAFYKTKTQLNHLANAFQSYYRARAKLSGMQYKDINYFRPLNCGIALPPNDLPCIDAYVDIDNTILTRLGLDASARLDGWGNTIQVSNLQNSNIGTCVPSTSAIIAVAPCSVGFAVVGPFTMSLQAITPWGTPILQTVDAPD